MRLTKTVKATYILRTAHRTVFFSIIQVSKCISEKRKRIYWLDSRYDKNIPLHVSNTHIQRTLHNIFDADLHSELNLF